MAILGSPIYLAGASGHRGGTDERSSRSCSDQSHTQCTACLSRQGLSVVRRRPRRGDCLRQGDSQDLSKDWQGGGGEPFRQSKGPGAEAAVSAGASQGAQHGWTPRATWPHLPPPGLRAAGISLHLPRPVSWCVKQGHNFLFCLAAKTKYANEGLILVRGWPS